MTLMYSCTIEHYSQDVRYIGSYGLLVATAFASIMENQPEKNTQDQMDTCFDEGSVGSLYFVQSCYSVCRQGFK